jgi:hypothetical protein
MMRYVVIAALGAVVLASYAMSMRGRASPASQKRAAALSELAQRLGMRFAAGISAPLPRGFTLLEMEHSLSTSNWLLGIRGTVWVAAFEVWWTSRGLHIDSPGGDTNHTFTAVFIPDAAFAVDPACAHLLVVRRGRLEKALHAAFAGAHGGPSPLGAGFAVGGRSAPLAAHVIAALAPELLAAPEVAGVELRDDGMVVAFSAFLEPEALPAAIDRALALHARTFVRQAAAA